MEGIVAKIDKKRIPCATVEICIKGCGEKTEKMFSSPQGKPSERDGSLI